MKRLFVTIGFSLLWSCVYSQSCVTPLQQQSECVNLDECPPILAAFNSLPIPTHLIQFLRQSQCGFDRYTPKVCCGPLPSSQPQTTRAPRPFQPRPTQAPDSNIDPSVEEDSYPESRRKCGIDHSDRIFGGQITDLDEFPWMALLGYRRKRGSLTYQCGGTLLNHRYILTAAHCVVGEIERVLGPLETVRLGEYDTQTDIDCVSDDCADPVQEIRVAAAYPNPGFVDGTKNRKDDIAVVRLAKRAQYSGFVKPICLPNGNLRLDVGNDLFVAGWGKTLEGSSSVVKLKLAVPVYDKQDCVAKYRNLKAELTDKQICAGGKFAQDACRGDSGGPLMRKNGDSWESVAVVSFGYGCGRDGWPGVYTSVPSYIDWIHDTIRSTNV